MQKQTTDWTLLDLDYVRINASETRLEEFCLHSNDLCT